MAEFIKFKTAVAKQFKLMCESNILYRVDVSKDELWETYLESYPEETNQIYKVRREYDCNYCKRFIRTIGDVVIITPDNKLMSIWDIDVDVPHFQLVADKMSELVKSKPIYSKFMHIERVAGVDKNFYEIINPDESKSTGTYEHFFVNIPDIYVASETTINEITNMVRTGQQVFKRALDTINIEALDVVLELIDQNTLERGEEFKAIVERFKDLKIEYEKLTNEEEKELWAWNTSVNTANGLVHIRNHAIGTLLIDLSEDTELDEAVRKFESVMAPENYKRTKSVVTKSMIDKAKKTITELGYTSALERRPATINDITVNNILFVDRNITPKLNGDVFDMLAKTTKEKKQSFDKVEDVTIDTFVKDILPNISTLEMMVENKHSNNFMTLLTAKDPTAKYMFKWDNPFSWSYRGETADAIKERVKAAGGSVTGDLCIRLAWDNEDDYDLHVREPNGYEIFFINKGRMSPNGGMLDVDKNAQGYTLTTTPVENVIYTNRRNMQEGIYLVYVHNYCQRRNVDYGFELDIDYLGSVTKFSWDKLFKTNERVNVVAFKYTYETGIEIMDSIPASDMSKIIWNIPTHKFVKVKTMMYSPNYWDDHGVGNKHYFFVLNDCKCDEAVRGFYNEFLKEELHLHRKVFEVLGDKLKMGVEDNSTLCGVGFSSTLRNEIVCRVTGAFTRVLRVKF